ncbi:MAG: tRNA (guanosine(46)-N7)-methyltransferase TrmB [Ilumatobacter sp.]|uniref:tRNA (guanosine(46)-N7)-methyltransferase TrmB n=1 Tax=Ilumatobacter sp. TaxID=1967498 RepID=UPI0026252745|nr:tRNA (guanosine(46)-N7)-methyltransferase TrmB [Ilumatobacter sp.]MDJ0771702.1 tRNA (guanosine(46)-N7)-methyltransferase TrmB [Ilumatobacter sp.]
MSARPPIRTFKPRRRPLSDARAALLERLAPAWCLPETGAPFDPTVTFGRSAPLVLDIGIGFGDTLTTIAGERRDWDLIGADVHTPGIASTLARIEAMELTNVRLVHGDALVFVERLAPASLDGIWVFFPDPWPKARHRHRRIASESNIETFVALLRPGGSLHVATDIDDYAAQVERVCGSHPALDGGVVPRPGWRPRTRYERKGMTAGRRAIDLIYRRA